MYIGSLRLKLPTGTGPFDVDYDPVTNLQTRLPTGSGFYGLQAGISFLLPSDPLVLFSRHQLPAQLQARTWGNGFGTIKPGDVLDLTSAWVSR